MEINSAKDIMWLGVAFLCVFAGGGLAYMLWRTARLLVRLEKDLHRTIDEVVPVIAKTSVSVDSVNDQLGKVDLVLDSAVDMAESLDTTVRAVSIAVTEPVKKASAAFAGVSGAVDGFRDRVNADGEASPAAGATS